MVPLQDICADLIDAAYTCGIKVNKQHFIKVTQKIERGILNVMPVDETIFVVSNKALTLLKHPVEKDLARPQHRIIMLFITITNSLIGNVPNVYYTSNMTIYIRIFG